RPCAFMHEQRIPSVRPDAPCELYRGCEFQSDTWLPPARLQIASAQAARRFELENIVGRALLQNRKSFVYRVRNSRCCDLRILLKSPLQFGQSLYLDCVGLVAHTNLCGRV